jgi:hypothetical protein
MINTKLDKYSQFIGKSLNSVFSRIETLAKEDFKHTIEVRDNKHCYAAVYLKERLQVHVDEHKNVIKILEG